MPVVTRPGRRIHVLDRGVAATRELGLAALTYPWQNAGGGRMRRVHGFAILGLFAVVAIPVAEARVDPRAYWAGTFRGVVTAHRTGCSAPSDEARSRTFVIRRERGGLTLREPGTNARCRLVLEGDTGLRGVTGRCRVDGVDVQLTLEATPEGALRLEARSDSPGVCTVALSATLESR